MPKPYQVITSETDWSLTQTIFPLFEKNQTLHGKVARNQQIISKLNSSKQWFCWDLAQFLCQIPLLAYSKQDNCCGGISGGNISIKENYL